MKTTAVIMAGGRGERFWPRSRLRIPKQFLSLTDDGKTMIQLTVERHLPMVAYEDMFVVSNKAYVDLVREQLPEIPIENILAEPYARNTAPCVGFAASVIRKKYGDAMMITLASDHLILNKMLYLDTLVLAMEVAREDQNLVTIGITPTYPETGYGYIHFEKDEQNGKRKRRGVYGVRRFVEKPSLDTAKEYIASGEYLWNSGMFVWKSSTILEKFQELQPDTYDGLIKIENAYGTHEFNDVLETCFSTFRSESIDYGIMEHAVHIYTIPGNFGWDDVGSWLALARINKTDELGNMIKGDVVAIDTHGSIISGGNRLIAAIGLEELVVVDTDDALLICQKDRTGEVKRIIEQLRTANRDKLL